ncbi:hypothetical protein ACVRXF_10460 [Streptococcus orisasini]
MLVGNFLNYKDRTTLRVVLPVTFEKLLGLFEEKTEILTSCDSHDFKCVYLNCSFYQEEYSGLDLEVVNDIAEAFTKAEKSHTDKELAAYFEKYDFKSINSIDNCKFYGSKEAFVNKLYEKYGLTDIKFLWTTIDNFLDDEAVFEEFCLAGNSYQATNGIVVEVE